MMKFDLIVKGRAIRFYYNGRTEAYVNRILQLKEYYEKIPNRHLNILSQVPIIIVAKLPGGRDHGGGYYDNWRIWLGRSKRTEVEDDIINSISTSIIGITKKAFNKDIRRFTILHESAHAIDHVEHIYPKGADINSYRGVRYPRPSVGELAAEVYARYILVPTRIYREDCVPKGESKIQCNTRLKNLLMSSEAGSAFSMSHDLIGGKGPTAYA